MKERATERGEAAASKREQPFEVEEAVALQTPLCCAQWSQQNSRPRCGHNTPSPTKRGVSGFINVSVGGCSSANETRLLPGTNVDIKLFERELLPQTAEKVSTQVRMS